MVFLDGLFSIDFHPGTWHCWFCFLMLLVMSLCTILILRSPAPAEPSQANSTPCECWKPQLQMRQKSSNTAVDKSFPGAIQRFPCRCGACCCGKRSLCKECCLAVLCHCIQLQIAGQIGVNLDRAIHANSMLVAFCGRCSSFTCNLKHPGHAP